MYALCTTDEEAVRTRRPLAVYQPRHTWMASPTPTVFSQLISQFLERGVRTAVIHPIGKGGKSRHDAESVKGGQKKKDMGGAPVRAFRTDPIQGR